MARQCPPDAGIERCIAVFLLRFSERNHARTNDRIGAWTGELRYILRRTPVAATNACEPMFWCGCLSAMKGLNLLPAAPHNPLLSTEVIIQYGAESRSDHDDEEPNVLFPFIIGFQNRALKQHSPSKESCCDADESDENDEHCVHNDPVVAMSRVSIARVIQSDSKDNCNWRRCHAGPGKYADRSMLNSGIRGILAQPIYVCECYSTN
jgi:hypothetical protein